MLVSVQVCAGVTVLREWGILAVNGDSTFGEVFHGLSTGQIESADGFHLPEQYADSPVSCSIAPILLGKFESIPLSIKVQDAVEFGVPTTSKNDIDILMKEAGRLKLAAQRCAVPSTFLQFQLTHAHTHMQCRS